LICFDNQFNSIVSPTSVLDINDLEDGHPNHQLWRKMTEPIRPQVSDR